MPGERVLSIQDREEREVISAKISRRAAEGWRVFCERNGISVTAMLEIAGLELEGETAPPTVEARRQMVESARELDTERRRRRRS